jgi:Icc-related predicted phosphoesterase
MRILAVADLHYSLPQYDWLLGVAGEFDVVVLAGDHLDLSSLVDFRAQILVVCKYCERIGARTRLITCSGNHDLDSRGPAGEKVAQWLRDLAAAGTPAEGASVAIGDTLITTCPWWDGPIVRADIARLLAETAAARRETHWIWVHHAPPGHSPTSWTGARDLGDAELRQWVETYRPDAVFCGHVHQSPFVHNGSWVDRIGPTWIFNAGHQFGAPPAHVIYDTDERMALWFSAAGRQLVHLDRPLARPVAKLTELPAWLTSPLPAAAGPSPAQIPGSAGG